MAVDQGVGAKADDESEAMLLEPADGQRGVM